MDSLSLTGTGSGVNRKVRHAVEKLIEEADKIAKAASTNYVNPTDDIFGDEETEA